MVRYLMSRVTRSAFSEASLGQLLGSTALMFSCCASSLDTRLHMLRAATMHSSEG